MEMKKLILASAIACALPTLALADVTITGTLAVGLDSLQYAGNNNATSTANAPSGYATNVGHARTTGVDDLGSEIVIKGDEDLGNGLKTIWKISSGFNANGTATPGSGKGVFADRESFVGLDDATYGSIKMGKLNDTLVLTESTDNFYGPRRDYGFGGGLNVNTPLYEEGATPLGGFGELNGDGRVSNTVRYDSPTYAGFSYNLDYNASETTSNGHMAGDQYGVHVNYSNAATGLFIGGAYKIALNEAQNSAGTHNGYTERLEGGYNGDALTVAFTLNRDSLYGDDTSGMANAFVTVAGLTANTAAHLTGNSWGSYIAYQIGNWKPQIEYSQRFNSTVDGVTLNTGAREASFELDYSLSKRTILLAGYAEILESAGLQALQGDSSDVNRLIYTGMVHHF
jgi:predicted porin